MNTENMTANEQAVLALTLLRESAAQAPLTLAIHDRDTQNYTNLKQLLENISFEAANTEETK